MTARLFEGAVPLAGMDSPATELEWSEVTSNQIKLVSATIGASAVLAMGAFAVASSDTSAAEPP